MKATLLVEGDSMSIVLTPETNPERHIMSLVGPNKVLQAYPTPTGDGPSQNAIVLKLGKE